MDRTNGLLIRPRLKKYRDNDIAIQNLVREYDNIADPTHEETLHFLRSIQHRLQKNNFDDWDDPDEYLDNGA